MEKFHYNPVSVNKETLKFFPNMETLHIYGKDCEYLEGRKIEKYVDWRYLSFMNALIIKQSNHEKKIEFKNVTLNNNDVLNLLRKDREKLFEKRIITLDNAHYKNLVNLKKLEKEYNISIASIDKHYFSFF